MLGIRGGPSSGSRGFGFAIGHIQPPVGIRRCENATLGPAPMSPKVGPRWLRERPEGPGAIMEPHRGTWLLARARALGKVIAVAVGESCQCGMVM
jgi:hypothetical protein